MRRSNLILGAAAGLVLAITVGRIAHAGELCDVKAEARPGAGASDRAAADTISCYGITLFGTVDAGFAYQTHGVPLNKVYPNGLEYSIQRNSNGSISSRAPNGLSQSTIGLKGDIALDESFSAVLRLEAGFDPLSLRLADGPGALVENNGVAATRQNANGDSGRAGQFWNGSAYVGLKSKTLGTLSFGRQNGLLADKLVEYDPNGSSYAFSLVGGSGTIKGFGDTQNATLNSSLKYTGQFGLARVGAQYQFGGKQYALFSPDGVSGSAAQLSLGGDYGNFSADVIYARKNQAISAASLTAAQVLTLPAGSLAATVSDNTAYALTGRYSAGLLKAYAGYEHTQLANPSSPLAVGTAGIGGYRLSVLTQNAYNTKKVLEVYWAGAKYAATPRLNLSGTYYGYRQNSYSGNGCANASNSKCSGSLSGLSVVAIYGLLAHLEVYGGVLWSKVADGMASGYINNSTVTSMVGGRLTF